MRETKRPLKVFLCHASIDKPKVRELYRYLRRRGVNPWFDEEHLVGGQDWQVEIPKALATSDAIIICLTKNSVDKEGYIQKEIKFALDKALDMPEGRIFLIPIKFEECEVPFALIRYQWVDLTIEAGYSKMMKALKFRASQLERTTVELSKKSVEEENLALEKAAKEKVEREAVEKAAREKAEKESAEKERLEAEELAKQKAAKEKSEREAAEKVTRKQAEKEAAEKARLEEEEQARQKAAKEKIERQSAEKAAREKVEKETAEKTRLKAKEEEQQRVAKEKVEREVEENIAREKAEKKPLKKIVSHKQFEIPSLKPEGRIKKSPLKTTTAIVILLSLVGAIAICGILINSPYFGKLFPASTSFNTPIALSTVSLENPLNGVWVGKLDQPSNQIFDVQFDVVQDNNENIFSGTMAINGEERLIIDSYWDGENFHFSAEGRRYWGKLEGNYLVGFAGWNCYECDDYFGTFIVAKQ